MIPRSVRSTATLLVALALGAPLLAQPVRARASAPASASALSVPFAVERVGGGGGVLFGAVRTGSSSAYERVVLLAEGLDEQGAVVSRGRAYVSGVVPGRGAAPFEVRIPSGGREKRFRVTVEAYQIAGQSP